MRDTDFSRYPRVSASDDGGSELSLPSLEGSARPSSRGRRWHAPIARCPRCVRGRGVRRAHSTAVDANYSRNLYCTVDLVLAPGQTAVLIATVQADSGADASVRWSSQTPSSSVDQNGLVTGIATGLGEIIVAARGDTTKPAGASVRVTYSEVASAEIGSAGGVIAASSGFATLTIPPGVLQSSTNIRLSIDDASSLAQRSPRITIEPDGMQFERPVRLEIHHSPAPGTLTAPRLYYHDPESGLLLQRFLLRLLGQRRGLQPLALFRVRGDRRVASDWA